MAVFGVQPSESRGMCSPISQEMNHIEGSMRTVASALAVQMGSLGRELTMTA
jgi:hypothetical protein